MQLCARLLLLAALALCCFPTRFAFLTKTSQCRCLTTTISPISKQHFQRIEIFPPGATCRNTEIVITLKNGKMVCVDPEATWIQPIIDKILKRSKNLAESSVPTKTSS